MTVPTRPAVLVLGATGCIGRAAVAAAVDGGRRVIAVSDDADALAALGSTHPYAGIVPVVATVASDADAATLAQRLQDLDIPLAGAIAAIRGDAEHGGRLLDQPADFLRRRLDEDLLPHLFAARHLLPLLVAHTDPDTGRHGGYVLIGGPGADQPWAGYGHRSVGAAALQMLARVLHEEARDYPLRVQLLSIDAPMRTDDNARHACSAWPHVGSIARRALAMADGRAHATTAIVRCPSRDSAFDEGTDDLDAGSGVPARGIDIMRRAPAVAPRIAPIAHEADGRAAGLAQTSFDDARALLRAIATAPRLQETSR